MKCENCGKREANVYYSYTINGKHTEKHLCDECAAKLGINVDLFDSGEDMFGGLFESFFGRRALSPFGGFGWSGFGMPTMLMPRIEISLDGARGAVEEKAEKKAESEADPELSKRRELNMLREQMKKAVEAEEFEKAAELRDKIKELDK